MRARQARLFTRRHELRRWTDRYFIVLAIIVLGALTGGVLRTVAIALSTSDPLPLAKALAAIVLCVAGFVAVLRVLGPVALPGPDAYWLLLSPLERRDVLRRPVIQGVTVSAVLGAAGGIAALAVIGPRDDLTVRIGLAAIFGMAAAVSAFCLAVLKQRWPRVPLVSVAGLALLGFGAVGTAVASGIAAGLTAIAWAALKEYPASAVVAASQRLGGAVDAAVGLQPNDFTRAAEDRYWRSRRLRSRRWPRLPRRLLVAWPDWRMLARRPARLALIVLSPLLALLAPGIVLFGVSLAVAACGATSVRRGIPASPAHLLLPTALAGAWLAAALGPLWLLGLAAAPTIAVAAVRMAARGPVDHASVPVVFPQSGSWIPTGWLIWILTGLDVAVLGGAPLLICLLSPPADPRIAIIAQILLTATVLALRIGAGKARRRGRT